MANGNRGNGKAAAQAAPEEPPQRPAHEVRLGRVKAAVWGNDSDHGVLYSVTVCRVYKDGQGQWQTSAGFGRDDLLLLAKVLDRAHSWICEATQGELVPF